MHGMHALAPGDAEGARHLSDRPSADHGPLADLDALGVEIDGELDCSSDVDDDNVVVGTCAGSTTDGRSILTTLDDTIESARCSARITILVGDEVVYDESGVDCLAEPEK